MKNIRNYSSCKEPPCNKSQLKSDDCDKTTRCSTEQDVSNDSKFNEGMKGCSQLSRKCQPPIEDIFDEYTPPCSDIEDYCPKVAYQDTFLKLITTIGLILLISMSCYVYTKVKESGKQPRPDFIDVPYMRRITKPFPWGDGHHTLFHNPVRNPISPHGYEVEDPNVSYFVTIRHSKHWLEKYSRKIRRQTCICKLTLTIRVFKYFVVYHNE
ncbi:uncharacterized protein LOC122531636 isoform X3 [Frieseomelitta varia]|uniref:uncharacterized protein LOC122531636 isoform X3 n=1 Tax=Frieseomelitta varia TaxID=561572 RepID=UPI001CB68D45|nr:uncharacterized protein LOC122531636 isoform X3 [Frieseomelitta varia]